VLRPATSNEGGWPAASVSELASFEKSVAMNLSS
jgi:hypothetical protein